MPAIVLAPPVDNSLSFLCVSVVPYSRPDGLDFWHLLLGFLFCSIGLHVCLGISPLLFQSDAVCMGVYLSKNKKMKKKRLLACF